ncbi:putative transcription factor & chromatin remodeling ARID family [Rosa chinensis]|uniref:Putative transcription factor & chromatin remodeling ARID family n=1 Tax=Rosa chinensis TaxID=74649 RepID=A0A2P6R7A4_ROSCH|nr:putative transcription factor & chromatin remodeling ARID family [Rosa chinensis]
MKCVKNDVEFGDADGNHHKGTDLDTVKDSVQCIHVNNIDCRCRQRYTFDQILSVFLKDIGHRYVVIPHMSAVFSNRQHVDLFRFFSVVRHKDRYDLVSKKRLWCFVSK